MIEVVDFPAIVAKNRPSDGCGLAGIEVVVDRIQKI
jgi:hypothetical protein